MFYLFYPVYYDPRLFGTSELGWDVDINWLEFTHIIQGLEK